MTRVETVSNVTERRTTTLYRPTGERELALIRSSGWRTFPPGLPDQPFFYPVLNEEYATAIARDWNTRDGGTGYVLRFAVDDAFLARYTVQTVGAPVHQEYWIPAEDLKEFNRNVIAEEFNRNVIGSIEMVATFRGAPER